MIPLNRKRLYKPYLWTVIAIGGGVCLYSAYHLPLDRLGIPFLILALATVTIASRMVVRFFRFSSCISISDVFIFLTLLQYGGEAAILLGAAESFYSSLRITKKPLTMLFNLAAMACSTCITACILHFCFGSAVVLSRGHYTSNLIVATCLMAFVQYVANSGIVAIAASFWTDQGIWSTWRKHYVWTSITYFAGASAAGVISNLISAIGFYAFLAVIPIITIVYFTYITYVKNVESSTAQAESEKRFHRAFDHAPIGMALASPDGKWLQVNNSLCKITGYSEQEMLAMDFQAITHPEDLGNFLAHINRVLKGKANDDHIEKRYIHKQGHEVWVVVGVSLLDDKDSEATNFIFQIQDITVRKQAENQLLYEAYHDSLTGLPNRSWFIERLRSSLESLEQDKENLFAVLFLDLNRFKIINDSIGHMFGDHLLIEISKRLKRCLRPEDKVARLGGDEFTILLSNIRNLDETANVVKRIQMEIARPFLLNGYETFTTASIGIAYSDAGYTQPEELLRDADTAMYQAKLIGEPGYVVFDKSMHARAMNVLQLETDLRRAVDRNEFFVEYQPIVSLKSGRLKGFEALIRWNHPEQGRVAPGNFIGVAEETGMILPIGIWVLQEACRQLQSWQKQFDVSLPLYMSVNLSSKQFAHSQLLENIIQIIGATGLDPYQLKLEITESVVMENIEVATEMLKYLRKLGLGLSIDDFGTGYSSLSYLHRLPIDNLKIDRSFVSSLDENSENREIVRTIITLAQNLKMGVTAEGIETVEHLCELQELGCDNGQGYLLSRPLNQEAAGELIQNMLEGRLIISNFEETFQENTSVVLASTYNM